MKQCYVYNSTKDIDFFPYAATEYSVGYDIRTNIVGIPNRIILRPFGRCLIFTGIHIAMIDNDEIDATNYCWVVPRSGLAYIEGITVLNAPGLIDPDYTGEIKVILYNSSEDHRIIQHKDRIAQLVFHHPVQLREVYSLDSLPTTKRGDNGFGSTGK